MEDTIPFASREYFILLAVLTFARGMDILSTRIATPNLVLEGNPVAKWLGWKGNFVVNIAMVFGLAMWPFSAIAVSTTSLMVAARNFQSAWMMRTMGEEAYRDWYVRRVMETPRALYVLCLCGNSLLVGVVGVGIVIFSSTDRFLLIVPTAIGVGIILYAVAVLGFTLLALWRGRRRRIKWNLPPDPEGGPGPNLTV